LAPDADEPHLTIRFPSLRHRQEFQSQPAIRRHQGFDRRVANSPSSDAVASLAAIVSAVALSTSATSRSARVRALEVRPVTVRRRCEPCDLRPQCLDLCLEGGDESLVTAW
jgi:hypothetical protein